MRFKNNNLLRTTSFWFLKNWDCLEIEIDQRVWDRISACIDFIFFFCNKCNPWILLNKFVCVFAEKWCVFLRGSRSAFLVLVCWPREVCVLRGSRSLSWLYCKWSRFDCLVEFLSNSCIFFFFFLINIVEENTQTTQIREQIDDMVVSWNSLYF